MKFNNRNKTELKSVDFAKDKIVLKFSGGVPDGYLDYRSVKSLEVTVSNSIYTYKGSERIRIDNIHISITLGSDKVLELDARGGLRQVYSLIDLQRRVGAFKLSLEGAADTLDFALKLYSKTGRKYESFIRYELANMSIVSGIIWVLAVFFLFFGDKDNSHLLCLLLFPFSILLSLGCVIENIRKKTLRKELGL